MDTPPQDPEDATGLDAVEPATHHAHDAANFRRILSARADFEEAEIELRDAVNAARAAGDSWVVIAAALGSSPRAAFRRFGTTDASVDDPHTDADLTFGGCGNPDCPTGNAQPST